MFQKAVKHESKLRMAVYGPSGSGKTYTCLRIATGMGGKIAYIDTERGSASKYADEFDFDVLNLDPPYHPQRFLDAIAEAEAAGYDIIIVDSLSHAYNGPGGLLEIVDQEAARSKSGNTYIAWGKGTPIQQKFIDGMTRCKMHLFGTMRSKTEYVVETNDRGKSTPRKVGMAPIQRDGMEYEFDVCLDMNNDNQGIVQKTRCSSLTGKVFSKPGQDVANLLKAWLSGEAPPPPPAEDNSKALAALKTLAATKFAKPDLWHSWLAQTIGKQPVGTLSVDALRDLYKKVQAYSAPTATNGSGKAQTEPDGEAAKRNTQTKRLFAVIKQASISEDAMRWAAEKNGLLSVDAEGAVTISGSDPEEIKAAADWFGSDAAATVQAEFNALQTEIEGVGF